MSGACGGADAAEGEVVRGGGVMVGGACVREMLRDGRDGWGTMCGFPGPYLKDAWDIVGFVVHRKRVRREERR